MRVLFDGQVFALQVTGGISRYFANLIAGLDEEPGVSAHALAPLHRNLHLADVRRRLVIGARISNEKWAGQVARYSWGTTRAMSPIIGAVLPADIVHETYFAPMPYIARARRRVTTLYDMINELYLKDTSTTEHKRASIARCDHIICISHNTKKDLCELFDLGPERASVVHLGYQDFSTQTICKPAVLSDASYFLYVGHRGDYKNFARFMRAFASSDRLKKDCRIVCFGGAPLTAAERGLATELGLGDHHLARLAGGDDSLGAAYRNAIALIYPSLYEGFGLPPLEAMSASCPVLCSNTSSLPEVVGDAAITFDPMDIEAMTDSMERIAESTALRRDLVQRGHERRKFFSWLRCVKETLNVYRRLN
jgi:glycosyltransferase involved in cell wall biosynthesis